MADTGGGAAAPFPDAPPEDRGPIAFAEKLLTLLDEGRFTATYKYALLLALMDTCLEHASASGGAPESVTTRDLAGKVLELYWPQALPFPGRAGAIVLRQNTGREARILQRIRAFREAHAVATVTEARFADPNGFEALLDDIEWTLALMPIPKLQRLGDAHVPFVYRIGWDDDVRQRDFRSPGFDRRLHLQPGAGDHLIRLAGLLRPLIQRQWASMVANLNRDAVESADLDQFLFGAERLALARVRVALREIQHDRCFYCGTIFRSTVHVDHFIPWARYPDNGIENLVAAHPACNEAKRAHLAAAEHVSRWRERFVPGTMLARELESVATSARWDRHPDRTLAVARAIYLRLPSDAKLWRLGRDFVDADRSTLLAALGVA